jgi:uncharacterized protein (UPF0276 family)
MNAATERVLDALVGAVADRSVRAGPSPLAIPAERLQRYAESLLDKRVGELQRALPATAAVCPSILRLYRGWLARRPAPASDDVLAPGVREGLRAELALRGFLDEPWMAELLRYELYRAASRQDGQERVLTAGWSVHEVAAAVARGECREHPRPGRWDWVFAAEPELTPPAGRVRAPAPSGVHAAVSYRRSWRSVLLDPSFEGPDALEVVADHFFAEGRLAELEALAERYPITVHDVGCSLAGGGPSEARLARLARVVRAARAVGFSDHLALTVSPSGVDLGHLLAPWPTEDVLEAVIQGVRRLQDALDVPVAVENISAAFRPPGSMSEAELLTRVVERTGCGLLLDLTNLLLDARNDGRDPRVAARELPLQAATWAHLAGGRADGDWWIDSHSSPVDDASFELLAAVAGSIRLQGVIVERDHHLPRVGELIAEARRGALVAGGVA